MAAQTKTIKTAPFVAPQFTVIPQQGEGKAQINVISGNQAVPYDGQQPRLVSPPQSYETFLIAVRRTRTTRDRWIEMSTFYQRAIICVIAIAVGIVAGLLTPSLYAVLEILYQ